MELWHNPRCSKSRQTLALLDARGVDLVIRRYLETPPSADEIAHALKLLGMTPRQLLRRGEAAYQDLGLDDPDKSDEDLIAAMAAHPILIERPILIGTDRAALGRPPEQVLDIL
ncbi:MULTISPECIES: arsenate reductase (glutaredoxin) [unclassified Iodidimonas]|jgi:arsenate reductase|uniref:arsenate reductase (glutaredoxin) n=1 Tax=unclassified Iodidimonas TaxID=2626145 RepID=UPI00248225F3|nr:MULTISPECIES: arsenate reductase (glutaredoxin) [unclassified Iodidimonas]